MFGLGSSSSSSSSNDPPPAPNREERLRCWEARDAYFDCLTNNKITIPGRENKNEDNSDIKGGSSICKAEREKYGKDCGKTWIEYFNKRRVMEARQQLSIAAAAERAANNPNNKR